MQKLVYLFAVYYFITGVLILLAPMQFYNNVPGLSAMGPFNMHFIIDVALVFIACSVAIFWGAKHQIRSTAIAGAVWPALHALFHLQIWGSRSFALDFIAASDFIAVIIPGFVVLWACSKISKPANSQSI